MNLSRLARARPASGRPVDPGAAGAVGIRCAVAVRPWARPLLLAPNADPELEDAGVRFPLTLKTREGAQFAGVASMRGGADPIPAVNLRGLQKG